MRKATRFLILALTVLVLLGYATADEGPDAPAGVEYGVNLVPNPGFEDGSAPWGRKAISDENPHSGSYCAKLDSGGVVTPWLALACPNIPVTPFVQYRVKFWIKRTTGEGYFTVRFGAVDAEGKDIMMGSWPVSAKPVILIPGVGRGDWQEFQGTFMFRRSDVTEVTVRLFMQAGADVVYLDDLSLVAEELPPAPDLDVQAEVQFPGDPTGHHMRVENSEQTDAGFAVTTTGARYTIDAAAATITGAQRIGAQRPVVSLQLSVPLDDLRRVRSDSNVCVLANGDFALGFQADSMVALATNVPMDITLTSNIVPEHYASLDANVLAIDESGGFSFYPYYEAGVANEGVTVAEIAADRSAPGWQIRYRVGAKQLLSFSVFPPRPFNWERSFEGVAVVYALPDDEEIEYIAKYANILWLFGAPGSVYAAGTRGGELRPADDAEYQRVIDKAHSLGMKVITYLNMGANEPDFPTLDDVLPYMQAFYDKHGLDGWYFDGLYPMDWVKAYKFIRQVRDMVGPEGIIYTHNTLAEPMSIPNMYSPFIDTYSDFLLRGEGQAIQGYDDPYWRYVISAYNISNSIGTPKTDKFVGEANKRTEIDKMFSVNGRLRWGPTRRATADPARWELDPEANRDFAEYYFPRLEQLRREWEAGQ